MRKIIMLKTEASKLSPAEIQQKIEKVVSLFDGYLDEYPVKSSKSKHAIMGPVAKVLDRAKAGQWAAEPLIGYALRMHEMNPRTRGGYVSVTAVENLRAGTEALLELCQNVPTTSLNTTVEQIDYSLYFRRRSKGIQWLEEQALKLSRYLLEKYSDEDSFRKAWTLKKKDNFTLETIHYFGKSSQRYQNGNQTLKSDMDAFYQLMREQNINPDSVDEDEEI